jgi:hypothetical protein
MGSSEAERRTKNSRRPGVIGTAVRGAGSGIVATAAMSVFLLGAQRVGLLGRQPPRIIVESVAPELPDDESRPTSVVAHFGYGISGGAGYRLLTRIVPAGVASGAAFGLAVWAASYEGWLPAMGILPPAHRDRPGRRWTMIAAHLVYGGVLGALARSAER